MGEFDAKDELEKKVAIYFQSIIDWRGGCGYLCAPTSSSITSRTVIKRWDHTSWHTWKLRQSNEPLICNNTEGLESRSNN